MNTLSVSITNATAVLAVAMQKQKCAYPVYNSLLTDVGKPLG